MGSAEHVNSFIKLVRFVKKDAIGVCLTVMLILMLAGGYVTVRYADRILDAVAPSAVEETTNFHKAIKRTSSINAALETVRTGLSADRLILSEFHNGKKNLYAVPWSFASARDAALAPGVSFDVEAAQSVPNTIANEYLAEMWADPAHPVCIFHAASDVKSSLARSRLVNRGTWYFAICPLQYQGTPLGMVTAGWILRDPDAPPTKERTLELLHQLAIDIEPLVGAARDK